ncbi:MAG: sugar-binding domain-containing protein, partial [Bacteroidota bacterium]
MKTLANLFFLLILISQTGCIRKDKSDRETILMDSNWQFINEDIKRAEKPSTKTTDWETVTVPHDWAISGEFDENNDSLTVLVWEDNERVPSLRTGRTGGLPHVGVGWYRKNLDIPSAWKDKKVSIEFDGVMSNAKVYLNGNFVGEWPYGYASFGFDLTEYVNFGGENILAVRAENKHRSARWYPGAGIYRNVRMIVTNPTHVKQWGTYITTPNLAAGKGDVNIATTILNQGKEKITLVTEIVDDSGNVIVSDSEETEIDTEGTVKQILTVSSYKLWSVEKPVLYKAISKIMKDGQLVDTYETTFGFRFIEFTNNNGFFLNGERVQLNGVCLHHDLGPLGAAVNYSALEYRMKMLQEMGCNSIRTSHNPPTPEMLQLADEMGFLIIDEAFDEWKFAKCKNGYHVLWD